VAKKLKPPDNLRTPGGHLTEEAKAWFYAEVRRSGRNPFKVGESVGFSRPTVRNLMKALQEQWADGFKLSPKQIAERLYQETDDEGHMPDKPLLMMEIPDPITKFEDLSKPAQQAHKELGYWRRRYLGRRNIEWQLEMCLLIMSWLEEARRRSERVRGVLNTPPGGGKTTTVTHDFPGWVISRDRNIRIGLGSRTTSQATAYSRRLRNTLERNTLLAVDFGRFKPEETEVWRQDEFIVDGVTGSEASIEFRLALAGLDYMDPRTQARMQDSDDEIHQLLKAIESVFVAGEKEPTVKALSQQMGFLGGRFDLNLWDDLVDDKNSKTPDQRNSLHEWWEEYAVSRAEPGGIIALVGTRFGKYDLFRHCRDMTYTTDEDIESLLLDRITSTMDDETIAAIREDLMREIYDAQTSSSQMAGEGLMEVDWTSDPDGPKDAHGDPVITPQRMQHKVYRYVKYPAHNDEACPAPGSLKSIDHMNCLLDPVRFKWHDLLRAKESNPRKYALTYQQEDESTEDNLIQEVWLTGGTDENNIIYPGCYNYGRTLLEIPEHLSVEKNGYLPRQDCFSIATVDPSAVNYWSVQWWIWHDRDDHDYLIDIVRARLTADSFLSVSTRTNEYHGIMDQWQQRSKDMGWPISMWIIEENAAQRYLFQHTYVNEWMQLNQTHIKGHESDPRKALEEYGVQTLRPRYRQGRVDLPYDQRDMRTRASINEFKMELTEWPDSQTDDMVNGHWFLENNRYKIPKGLKVEVAQSGVKHPFGDSMPPRLAEDNIYQRPDRRPSRDSGHRSARVQRRENPWQ